MGSCQLREFDTDFRAGEQKMLMMVRKILYSMTVLRVLAILRYNDKNPSYAHTALRFCQRAFQRAENNVIRSLDNTTRFLGSIASIILFAIKEYLHPLKNNRGWKPVHKGIGRRHHVIPPAVRMPGTFGRLALPPPKIGYTPLDLRFKARENGRWNN